VEGGGQREVTALDDGDQKGGDDLGGWRPEGVRQPLGLAQWKKDSASDTMLMGRDCRESKYSIESQRVQYVGGGDPCGGGGA
jgi:hypothetical protein